MSRKQNDLNDLQNLTTLADADACERITNGRFRKENTFMYILEKDNLYSILDILAYKFNPRVK